MKTHFVSREERSRLVRAAQEKARNLQKDIEKEWQQADKTAASLAARYGQKVSYMNQRLQRLPGYMKMRRSVNGWNAITHMKYLQIPEGIFSLSNFAF